MSTEVSDDDMDVFAREAIERARLIKLSDEELVSETLRFDDYSDCDLHVEELCRRVWPEWDK